MCLSPVASFPPGKMGAMSALGRPPAVLLGVLFLAGLLPSRSRAQEEACPVGAVTEVRVVNHSIFAPAELGGVRFPWAYRVVNWAHIRTRESFIREQILVKEGSCYDPLEVRESGRILRELGPMARVEEEAVRHPDGGWLVRFVTWDEWSTTVSIKASVEDQLDFKGVRLEENNFLGRGGQLSFKTNSHREKDDLLFRLMTRRFQGTLTEAHLEGGTTRTGTHLEGRLEYPFRGEAGRYSFGALLRHKDRDRSIMTGDRRGLSHLILPVRELLFLGWIRRRFGPPGNLKTLGLDLEASRPLADGRPRAASRNRYDDLPPAPDSMVERLGTMGEPLSTVRVGVSGGLRRLRFETGSGLDLVYGVQDVALGTELKLTLGRTLGTWDTRELGSYGALDLFAGIGGPWGVAQGELRMEGHFLDAAGGDGRSSFRDQFIGGKVKGYLRPPFLPNHTLYGHLAFTGVWNRDDYLQLSLGGGDWVRSLVDFEAPVSRRLALRLEERYRIPGLPPALDLGIAAFYDRGRGWGGSVPFSQDFSWASAVGGGIHLAFPARSGTVFRIEWAWPVDGSGGPVFRVVKVRGQTSR